MKHKENVQQNLIHTHTQVVHYNMVGTFFYTNTNIKYTITPPRCVRVCVCVCNTFPYVILCMNCNNIFIYIYIQWYVPMRYVCARRVKRFVWFDEIVRLVSSTLADAIAYRCLHNNIIITHRQNMHPRLAKRTRYLFREQRYILFVLPSHICAAAYNINTKIHL